VAVQEWDYEDDEALKGKSPEERRAIRKAYWGKRICGKIGKMRNRSKRRLPRIGSFGKD
jgi:hypothetical protein